MLNGDVVFQIENLPGNNHQRLHHGKTGKDRTRNKVRWENRGMPARHHRSGKVKTHKKEKASYNLRRKPLERSRKVARSGTKPVYQNKTDTVK